LHANAAADAWACAWAQALAAAGGDIAHSDRAGRDAAVGCSTGENVALVRRTGTPAVAEVVEAWNQSAPHLANIKNAVYTGVGTGYVVAPGAGGVNTMYGVTVLTLC
jgi:uncharacterized protein YkwD